MKTDTLMSSLREMITADVYVQLFAAGVVQANAETRNKWNDQYSRHETVVREELAKLGIEAGDYKRPPKFGPSLPKPPRSTGCFGLPKK